MKATLLPWIEKYRPKTLSDLVAHDDITNTIKRLIKADKLPHLLFYGPPGTGKTSTILAVAKEMFGERVKGMVLELNASDSRGIDTVRNQIQTFAGTRTLFGKPSDNIKIVILDEADNMTKDAQMALRRVIEKFSRHTRFCLICNYASKIIPALQSRCTKFRFSPLKEENILEKMNEIIDHEKLLIEDNAKKAVINLSNGDMRRVLNLLQSSSLAISEREISCFDIYSIAGKPTPKEITNIYQKLLNDSYDNCIQLLDQLRIKGLALEDIISDIYPLVSKTELPSKTKSYLIKNLAIIESNLSKGTDDKLQQLSLVGSFVLSRTIAQEELEKKEEKEMEVES